MQKCEIAHANWRVHTRSTQFILKIAFNCALLHTKPDDTSYDLPRWQALQQKLNQAHEYLPYSAVLMCFRDQANQQGLYLH